MINLPFKVYDEDGVLWGATRDATFAATLVMHLSGGKVKYGRRIVYQQADAFGPDDDQGDGDAGESFDIAAETMLLNVEEHRRARLDRDALVVRDYKMARLETN